MNATGTWLGTIRGTNFGNILLHLTQNGNVVTGVARLADVQFGTALFSVAGTLGKILNLTLTPERAEQGGYAPVTVVGNINPDGSISGQWFTQIPTQGFFTVARIAPQHSVESERRVFLVHGHDPKARGSVAGFLEDLGLVPIVLGEQPSGGRTIVEKLEDNSDVEFAIVLLTPDDVGRSRSSGQLRPRARQNVILELGYFVGKIGRNRVCALYTAGVEMPSDYHGVVYIHLDVTDGWKRPLAIELRQVWSDLNLPAA